ncbi:YciI family protein [Nocardia sp. CNY236]|uniref:YciI family protein n=1 Tax=Nocardia sp. CNY236 TaxID=1169152 RepID=UPI000423BB5C|nr:YciI family protein [Nocardia sp. CNY236]
MPIFAVHYEYSAATVPGRDAHRPAHRTWLAGLLTSGTLLTSGPYPDGSGALLLFRSASPAELQGLLARDPFAREGLIDDVRVVEWVPVLGAFTAEATTA